jgi:HEAT repeat protein
LTTDARLVIRTWDGVLERMTSRPAAEVCGQPLQAVVPDIAERGLLELLRGTLASHSATVLAPAIHHFLIPCPPMTPSSEFAQMQQRVVVTALANDSGVAGLAISVEDVTARMEQERQLARALRDADPGVRQRAVEQASAAGATAPLADAMRDSDWQVRRSAVDALARSADEQLLGTLVEALRTGHRDFSLLSSALRLLSATGIEAADALVSLLDSDDPDLRVQVALALGRQSGSRVVPALVGALADADPNVRFHAIESLGAQKAAAAVPALCDIVASDDFFLAFPALEALVQIGDPTAAPRIAARLHDPVLGGAAAEAIGALGDEALVPVLAAALDADGTPALAIVSALASIHARYEETCGGGAQIEDLTRRTVSNQGASRVLDFVRRASGVELRSALLVLSWTRLPQVGAALTHLLGDATFSHDVVETLVRFGSPVVDLLVSHLGRGAVATRRAAAVALGRIGDRRAVPALLGVLETGERDLLIPVAGALARLGDRAAFEPLLPLLGDSDPAVRQAVIGALNSIGHPDMASRICDLLSSADPNERESAVKVAGYFGYEGCADQLLARVEDLDERVRSAAIEHIAYLDDPRVRPALSRALTAGTPRCRAAAAASLGHMDDAASRADLTRALADSDPWVRYFAVRSLGRSAEPDAADALAGRALEDTAPPVRLAAIEALAATGGPRAVEILRTLAGADDPDIAVTAIRSLGTIRDADVSALLLDALRSEHPARREAAAQALASSVAPSAVEALQWTASADDDMRVVDAALAALGDMASRRGDSEASRQAVAALVAVAAGGDRRARALSVLARVPPAAVHALAGVLAADHSGVRLAAVEALGRIARPPASSLLVQALDDPEAQVRQRALEALARLGTRGVGRRMAQMARSDDSAEVRRIALLALERAGGADAEGTP